MPSVFVRRRSTGNAKQDSWPREDGGITCSTLIVPHDSGHIFDYIKALQTPLPFEHTWEYRHTWLKEYSGCPPSAHPSPPKKKPQQNRITETLNSINILWWDDVL